METHNVSPTRSSPRKQCPTQPHAAATSPSRSSPRKKFPTPPHAATTSPRKQCTTPQHAAVTSPTGSSPRKKCPSPPHTATTSPTGSSPRKKCPSPPHTATTSPTRSSPRKKCPTPQHAAATSPTKYSPRKKCPTPPRSPATSPTRSSPRKKCPTPPRSPATSPTRSSPRKKCPTPPRSPATSPSPSKRQKISLNDLSFKESSPSPEKRRKSLRRSVGNKRRTLPPIYHGASDLSKAISLNIPESDRLAELLQSCFEFSLRTLENSLSHSDGFSAESFNVRAKSMKDKFKRFVERLSHDGTLQRCTEKFDSSTQDEGLVAVQTEMKDNIAKFATESSRWDELLEDHKDKAVVLTRQLEENKVNNDPPPSVSDVPSSQDQVLQSKPDYNAILHQQGAVFDCMEITLDNIQQSVSLLNSFLEDTTSHLQRLSTQLKTQSFKPMEDSPVRTFLKVCKK
ncbi:kinetochore-associated protein DSN1 homolog [Eleutherodactylus coqui]|uniref:DSN1 n=1 Tax=Eleutherodactylus coqui TaxID=57060 RepID=A0A8J6FII6_ELECQ|nr:hypothetical protein GDO78_004849 [Eleutherodactylus coqui]